MTIPDPRTMAVAQRKPRTKSLVLDTMLCGGDGVLGSILNLSVDIQSDATGRIRYEYRHCGGKKMKQ